MRWQFSSPTPAWQGSAPFETVAFCSLPSVHVCGLLVDMADGSMRRCPEEEYPSEVIFRSILNGHLELLPAPGLLVKEDP